MPNTSKTLTKPEIKSADTSPTLSTSNTLDIPLPNKLDNQELNIPEMIELANLLGSMDNAQIWINTPHPLLDGRTPISYNQEGKLQEILTYFITAIETGQPS
jgi:Protein of unknown function (DUF2384)